jgi:hypothetical protein
MKDLLMGMMYHKLIDSSTNLTAADPIKEVSKIEDSLLLNQDSHSKLVELKSVALNRRRMGERKSKLFRGDIVSLFRSRRKGHDEIFNQGNNKAVAEEGIKTPSFKP